MPADLAAHAAQVWRVFYGVIVLKNSLLVRLYGF